MQKVLVQIFIPLADNGGQQFPGEWFQQISVELKERFGGVTIYQRAPVTGLWKEDKAHTVKDELVIFEVMADDLELAFWKPFQKELEEKFKQESILIRSSDVVVL